MRRDGRANQRTLTQLAEAFAVAMVLFVRPALIEYEDTHMCLRRLMKFPPVEVSRSRTGGGGASGTPKPQGPQQ